MRLKRIGTPLRVLFAFIGLAAVASGSLVGAMQVRHLRLGSGRAAELAIALLCGMVLFGGVELLWGAFRGEVRVRKPGWVRHRRN